MPRILIVEGSLNPKSTTAAMCRAAGERMEALGAEVDFLDLRETPLPLYVPSHAHDFPGYAEIARRVTEADAYILGTPDYHGGPSGTLKNFLDYFWREFTGKLFGYVCASHEKGLTPMDQLRTHVRQCYGWSLPYGVSGVEGSEVEPEEKVTGDRLNKRIEMLANDMVTYGALLAEQRRADLANDQPSFLAILRSKG